MAEGTGFWDLDGLPYNINERPMLEAALAYAAQGWRVLPLTTIVNGHCSCGRRNCPSPGKHPEGRLVVHGVKEASIDPRVICQWWERVPQANVGVACGGGLVVVDLDPAHGGTLDAYAQLLTQHEFIMTQGLPCVNTGGGGMHFYYTIEEGVQIRNSAGKLAKGIDIRAEGGYVVAPPSIHASGRRYEWSGQFRPYPLPHSLRDHLKRRETERAAAQEQAPSAAQPHADDGSAAQDVGAHSGCPPDKIIPLGTRHDTLVRIAGGLHHLGLEGRLIERVLLATNALQCQPPLDQSEVRELAGSTQRWSEPVRPVVSVCRPQKVSELLSQDLPELLWTVAQMLPEGLTLLAGKPKMGKSWLALQLALAVAQGAPALDSLATLPGSVLYLGLEDSPARMAGRVRRLLGEQAPPEALEWAAAWEPLANGGLDAIARWLQEREQPRLVIIDTLARVRGRASSNGSVYEEDYRTLTPLKVLAEERHISILVVHHLRKMGASDPMDEISGSTGLTGASDCNMVLQRERHAELATLHIAGRDVEDQELSLAFNDKTTRWKLLGPATRAEKGQECDRILTVLRETGRPMSPTEIAGKLGIESSDSIRQTLVRKLLPEGHVQKMGHGLYAAVDVPQQDALFCHDVTMGHEEA